MSPFSQGLQAGTINKRKQMSRYIDLKLLALGLPGSGSTENTPLLELMDGFVKNHQEKARLLWGHLPPVDDRIQAFLDHHLSDVSKEDDIPRLPSQVLELDYPGLAQELSLPFDREEYENNYLKSYRLPNGVLHNPRADRRTTAGVFHVAEGGLPVPADKKAVPKASFLRLLTAALLPPREDLRLPYLASAQKPAETFLSLLLRPIVVPEVPGVTPRKSMEIRFFAPGCLVSNLDFVEQIFGNGGDPSLPENDSALDVEHWSGHTGCVILAPHLCKVTKCSVGLPHISKATPRQIADGMCWEKETELYNDGSAFKVTCRTEEGIIVTLIADNYYGYCKKEVKTQISYAANLYGCAEEEHAGGALAFQSYSLGDQFLVDSRVQTKGHTLAEQVQAYPGILQFQPTGYATDSNYDSILYLPEDAKIELQQQKATWTYNGTPQELDILPGFTYIHPSGYKIEMAQHSSGKSWGLVGASAEGIFCHKPCTVSGGGKSEISKSLTDFILRGPIFIGNHKQDMTMVKEIVDHNYSDRFADSTLSKGNDSRPFLSKARSLGSVIKLLTPSPEYSGSYNTWLESIPDHVKALAFIIKRFYKEEWNGDWQSHFSSDLVNGLEGHALKYDGRELIGNFLRVGLQKDGSWRTFKLRQDYATSVKIQMEDDISASIIVPTNQLSTSRAGLQNQSVKLLENCELKLFQRPDEAINPGADEQTERDLSGDGNFISNFEPLTPQKAREIIRHTISFNKFTPPMRALITQAASNSEGTYFVSSAQPRLVEGKPSKNPRYLQKRPDLLNPRATYIAEMGIRLHRRVPAGKKIVHHVDAVLPGRRNNPPDEKAGVRALAVYGPIHYQELPELFIDFICSLTGKSPSTTGAGSEGALTKGPFNALNPTADLNNALLSYILTGYNGFTTAAGCVGPKYRVDHDISLLVPEIWCRLNDQERDPNFLIETGCLERVKDFTHHGQLIPASRLGYRITEKFVRLYFGRIFDSPTALFNTEMLRPELQDLDVFVDGMNNIMEAQKTVAEYYLQDGFVNAAIPPLKALIHIMATGTFEGKTVDDPAVRNLFDRKVVLSSDWYRERLMIKQQRDTSLWQQHVTHLERFLNRGTHRVEAVRLNLEGRLNMARTQLNRVKSLEYLRSLEGTIGADPLFRGA
jgi:phosphoenolpyruvate carboxykinase (diphosphate)